jgi:hypothetical protein
MSQVIIIGNTGLIGANVQKAVESQNLEFIGVSSKFIEFKSLKMAERRPRSSTNLNYEIGKFLTSDTIVINTAWIANERDSRNSSAHSDWANTEIALIDFIISAGCRYVSLGSIAEVGDKNISPSYGTVYSVAKNEIFSHLSASYQNFLWIRIASAFGQNDARKWLLTELLKYGEGLTIRDPNSMFNLSDVKNISSQILENALSERSGALNFWSNQWMSAENIKKCFIERSKPILDTCKSNYFSSTDPQGLLIRTESILEFFVSN